MTTYDDDGRSRMEAVARRLRAARGRRRVVLEPKIRVTRLDDRRWRGMVAAAIEARGDRDLADRVRAVGRAGGPTVEEARREVEEFARRRLREDESILDDHVLKLEWHTVARVR